MVLVYRVDVQALAPPHCVSVLTLANAADTAAPLATLDAFSYGCLYQDRSRILGVALIAERNGVHVVDCLSVIESEQNKGVGTELLCVVKDQLAPGVAASFMIPDSYPRRAALASFLETSGFIQRAQESVYEFRHRQSPIISRF